ncbi:MAG: long-chain fatty acid--CoA ligase, partial [Candidatus Pelagibacterales bacterium]
KGYLTKEGIKAPKSIDGYYDTGDIGDYKDGLLFIKGRKRDVIKKGGELISLALIENTALKNESVLEAAAIGKKDTLSGEDLYLILTIKGKFSLDKKIKEIRSFLSNKLRPIEMPKKIILTSKMPKTNSGKILKNSLLKLFEL